jgi:hypothetical protein
MQQLRLLNQNQKDKSAYSGYFILRCLYILHNFLGIAGDKMNKLLTTLIVLLLIILAGCTNKAKTKLISQGYPESYAEGYSQGCDLKEKKGYQTSSMARANNIQSEQNKIISNALDKLGVRNNTSKPLDNRAYKVLKVNALSTYLQSDAKKNSLSTNNFLHQNGWANGVFECVPESMKDHSNYAFRKNNNTYNDLNANNTDYDLNTFNAWIQNQRALKNERKRERQQTWRQEQNIIENLSIKVDDNRINFPKIQEYNQPTYQLDRSVTTKILNLDKLLRNK